MNDEVELADQFGDIHAYVINSQVKAFNEAVEKELINKKKDPKKKFWMLYAEGGSAPSHKHNDYMEAMMEAKRIMDQPNFKGARVYVLEATGVIEAKITKEFVHTEIKYEQEKQN